VAELMRWLSDPLRKTKVVEEVEERASMRRSEVIKVKIDITNDDAPRIM
jgi:hypothetical protein